MQRCLLRNHLGTPYSTKRDKFEQTLTSWFGDNVINLGHLLMGELTSALVQVDLGDLAGEVGESLSTIIFDIFSKKHFYQ